MLKGYRQADYSTENWNILLDIKASAAVEIDNATSVADVLTALDHAAEAMAAVHTLLDDAKAAAHASLDAAIAGYAQSDYSPENWAILLNAMETINTNDAASIADVMTALNNTEAAMAAVHTLLTDARIDAHANLETAHAVYSQADYSPDEWSALIGIKSAGDAAIDEAADLAGVEAALSSAVAAMAVVQTISQTLATTKSAAHDALAAAFGAYVESDYTGDDWTALSGYMAAGDTAINEATDLAGVEAAQSAVLAEMAGVQTIAKTLAVAKSAAHESLTTALAAYLESDYTTDEWAALTGHMTAGETVIDEATDLYGVEATLSAALTGMAGVQTIAQTLAAAKSAAHNALAVAFELSESNETVIEEVALIESEAIGDAEADVVIIVAQTEEPVEDDMPAISVQSEDVDANIVCGASCDAQEAPETGDHTPDTTEEMAVDSEPIPESTPSDIE